MTSLCSVIMRTSDFMKCFALTDRVMCMHTNTHTHTHTHTMVCAQSHAHTLIWMHYLQDLKACVRISIIVFASEQVSCHILSYTSNSAFNTRTFHNWCMLHSDIGQVLFMCLLSCASNQFVHAQTCMSFALQYTTGPTCQFWIVTLFVFCFFGCALSLLWALGKEVSSFALLVRI
jgi:hypothetical protein